MESFVRFPGFRLKALTFSYDDGVVYDRALIDIFKKYGMKGTFNLNSGLFAEMTGERRMTREEAKALYRPAGMEVAMHAYTHLHLEQMHTNEVMREVIDDRRALEDMTGELVTGMAYPYGTYSDAVVDVLRLAGVLYCRTVTSTRNFDIPTDWLRLPATCHHGDPALNELGDRFLAYHSDPVHPWRDRLQLFYVWGHSYEFNDQNNWDVIENFCAKMAGKDDIWYATNGEIFTYLAAADRLEFSVSGKICHNPTCTDVYVSYNNINRVIPAGATVTLG